MADDESNDLLPTAAPSDTAEVTHFALYCTPHMKIPGTLLASKKLLCFEPDALKEDVKEVHGKEVGAEQFAVVLEVSDIMECGAISMPFGESPFGDLPEADSQLGFFLQLQVRTLDGQTYCLSEDVTDTWFVVFRFREKDHLYKVANFLLDAMDELQKACLSCSVVSRTSVPFPCLDCMTELEHKSHHEQLERQLSQEQEQIATLAPGNLISNWAAFLSGPSEPCGDDQVSPASFTAKSPSRIDKVTLRLPEKCERSLLTKELAECLQDWLPVSLRLPGVVEWVMRYSPKVHGVSLSTFFRNLAEHEKSIVLIQDTDDCVFGGFATAAWEPFSRFYGTGEAFVFSFGILRPDQCLENVEVQFYPWTSQNDYFMYADHDVFGMGGGDGRHAFVIQENMLHGHSSPTATFKNHILSANEEFVVRDIEVWSLDEVQYP